MGQLIYISECETELQTDSREEARMTTGKGREASSKTQETAKGETAQIL